MRVIRSEAAQTAGVHGARVRRVRPGDWRAFQQRAVETFRAVERSAQAAEWAAVISIAPISAVSAAQALVAQRSNVVARPSDSNTAAELLLIHGADLTGLEQAVSDLRQLLERKVVVEHLAEPASETAALEIMEHTTRFVRWANERLAEET